jgi:hypothetical protein
MRRGEIIETGNHDELIANKGVYAALVDTQTLHDRKEEEGVGNKTKSSATELELSIPPANLVNSGDGAENTEKEIVPSPKQITAISIPSDEKDKPVEAKSEFMRRLKNRTDADVKAKMENETALKKPLPWKRLIQMSRPEYGIIFFGCVSSCFLGLVFPIFSLVRTTFLPLWICSINSDFKTSFSRLLFLYSEKRIITLV